MEQRVKILLFDVAPISVLGTICYQKLQYIISAFEPHIIFLVFDGFQLKQTGELFRSLDKEDAYVLIIVVMERCDPNEIFSFIKLDAADFIAPPQTVQNWLGEVLYYC